MWACCCWRVDNDCIVFVGNIRIHQNLSEAVVRIERFFQVLNHLFEFRQKALESFKHVMRGNDVETKRGLMNEIREATFWPVSKMASDVVGISVVTGGRDSQ
jgi:hypothetical protein